MTRVDSKYVMDKLQSGVKVLCVNFTTLKILDCGSMSVNNLIAAIKDTNCVFFAKTENDTTAEEQPPTLKIF